MDQRTEFLLQLLQKLGAPLMQAVNARPGTGDETGQQDATAISSLLSESVKISINLSQAMNLKPEDGDADAIRVALAALAGNLVADSYKQTGRVPADADSRRMTKALEAVIMFADSFAPAGEHAKRLETLDGTPPFFDAAQTNIYAIHALLPVIAVIEEFSFGQQDTRLIQDISDRLHIHARGLKDQFSVDDNPINEIVILQALAQIYASVHRAETVRLRDTGGSDQAASLDGVWAAFDRQLSMMEVLLTSMTGAPVSGSGRGGGKKPDVAVAEAPAAEAPAAPPSPPPPSAKPAAGNPMGFFKKN